MKKIIILSLGLVLFAAACNKDNGQTKGATTPPPAAVTPPATNPPVANPPTPTPAVTTINYTSSGFNPSTITVKKGTAVTFMNNSSSTVWPASAPHPSHTDYPAFDPKKAIAAGGSWVFTFDKVGSWKYHNHLNPTQSGTVVVTE